MKEREEEYEADCEEPEKLGPYELHEQVARSESGEVKLYRARHETSGVAALVFKPDTEAPEHPAPAKAWQAHCIASTSPSYLAVEVPHTEWSVPPETPGTEAVLHTVDELYAGLGQMADKTRPKKRRLGQRLLGGALGCALLLPLGLWRCAPHAPLRSAAAPAGEELEPFKRALANSTTPDAAELARSLPKEPFKGQKRPPCERHTEEELVGGCWIPHEKKAPCPNSLFEHEGKCYVPIFHAPPSPNAGDD